MADIDWSKYPVVRARVSPELERQVRTAAERAGETMAVFLRRVLGEITSAEQTREETPAV